MKTKPTTTPLMVTCGIKYAVIPGRDNHDGRDAIVVALRWVCPRCSGPRGEIKAGISYDGSRQLECDTWKNPCEHIDFYDEVRKEAAHNGLNSGVWPC